MDINFNTSNLIIVNFNPGAGGKFLCLCLGLNPNVLPMQKFFIESKMSKFCSEEKSLKMVQSVMRLSEKHQTHTEFSNGKWAEVYHLDGLETQKRTANSLFIKLTNQKKYFFFLTTHFDNIDNFKDFRKAKNIIVHKDERLLRIRGKRIKDQSDLIRSLDKDRDCFFFDISKVRQPQLFYQEIESLCVWLKIDTPSYQSLDILRKQFIKNLRIPLKKVRQI